MGISLYHLDPDQQTGTLFNLPQGFVPAGREVNTEPGAAGLLDPSYPGVAPVLKTTGIGGAPRNEPFPWLLLILALLGLFFVARAV